MKSLSDIPIDLTWEEKKMERKEYVNKVLEVIYLQIKHKMAENLKGRLRDDIVSGVRSYFKMERDMIRGMCLNDEEYNWVIAGMHREIEDFCVSLGMKVKSASIYF